MDKEIQAKLKMIIHHYGVRHQAKKLMEETAELLEASMDFTCTKKAADLNHLTEEIADCYVVANQLLLVFIKEDDYWMRKKIDELREKVGEELWKTPISTFLIEMAANIIMRIVQYENNWKNLLFIKEDIAQYFLALNSLVDKLNINENNIQTIMQSKIDRQLRRIHNNEESI